VENEIKYACGFFLLLFKFIYYSMASTIVGGAGGGGEAGLGVIEVQSRKGGV